MDFSNIINKGVSGVMAAIGGALAYAGIVDADTWAGVVTAEWAAGTGAIVGVVVYGFVKRVFDTVAYMWGA